MKNSETKIEGVKYIEDFNQIHPDQRGFFLEILKDSKLKQFGLPSFKQINLSSSKKNVIRGLHFQKDENAQGKLVQCISGHILDVVVDIDPNSPTYKRVEIYNLIPGRGAVYAPPSVAHGFWALAESDVAYGCTEEYNPDNEGGVNPNDKELDLPWFKVQESFLISPKDQKLPMLKGLNGD